MNNYLVIVELYRLGDYVYSWCLAESLAREFPDKKVVIFGSDVSKLLPINPIGLVECKSIPAPWLKKRWWLSPHKILQSIHSAAGTLKGIENQSLFILPRCGIIEKVLLKNKFLKTAITRTTSAVSARGRFIDLAAVHPFVLREQLLHQVANRLNKNTSQLQMSWPFLGERYRQNKIDANLILLCPEAGNKAREWSLDNWLLLGKHLTKCGKKVNFVMTDDKVKDCLKKNGWDVWVGTIDQLGHLMGRAYGVIAVDSFAGHFASAIGVPVFTLFGPQDPQIWRPYGPNNDFIQSAEASKHKFDSRRKIEMLGPRLMESISVEDVFTRTIKWLKLI